MIAIWTKGVIVTRWPNLAVSAFGIMAATALVGTIGAFGLASGNTMTARALSTVPVDWQVAIGAGADPSALLGKLRQAAPIQTVETVGYADSAAFQAHTGTTTQTTGPGQIVGLPVDYVAKFPGQVRVLLGSVHGVLLAQQTASNLHATVGDKITLKPLSLPPFDVTIDGIVDLPNSDPMFQVIGPQKGPGATAPPDNVVLLPIDQWDQHFETATKTLGSGARLQIQAVLVHDKLPKSPDLAYRDVTGKAKNFEVRAAGEAVVGDNLSARLNAVREDALFAQILLLFLGLPGVVLALLLTVTMTRSDAERDRREQALLGLRGASIRQIAVLTLIDAGLVASVGSLFGLGVATILSLGLLQIDARIPSITIWLVGSAAAGFLLSLAAVIGPALSDLHSTSVSSRRAWLSTGAAPLWRQIYADVILLAISAAIYWHSASTGYQVVLAPEGVATASVDYTAFLAPLFFWVGSGLLTLRLVDVALRCGRPALRILMYPLAGRLAATLAATIARQSVRLSKGTALVALTFAFATTLAIFDATYNVQLLVDARLTNGADVAVTGTSAQPAGTALSQLLAIPGAAAAEPMQHRFAYVGKDLQDLYGIDPTRIGQATDIVDAFFGAGGAQATLARLAATGDGVLVSEETITDFQLAIGDLINLQMPAGPDGKLKSIPFHVVGVVKEFPTAPRDSFLVANASYVAAQTANAGAEIVLIRAKDSPTALATSIRENLGPNSPLKTTDVSQAVHLIGSSLTAVDLSTLGRIELSFALLFVAMATGLTLWLGRTERGRSNAILLSLGADRSVIRSFLLGEAIIVVGIGLPLGVAIGVTMATMLVQMLGGVFDPPPDVLTYPLGMLLLFGICALAAAIIAVISQSRWTKEWAVRELRAGA